MRLLVVGAGSVGGYFGALLVATGRDVTFLVRPGRARQLAQGLTVRVNGRDTVTPVQTILAGQEAAPFDLVLIAVKAYQLEGAIEDLPGFVTANTVIMPTLNGLRHVDMLRARFGPSRVIGGVAKVAASLDEQGRVVAQTDFHELLYGEWDRSRTARIDAVDQFLKGAGFDARLSADIEQDLWEKWALLASLGAITCLMDGNIGEVARVSGGTDFARAVFDEVSSGVAAGWRPLADAFKKATLASLLDPQSTRVTSMFRDMRDGHPTEADQILGDFIARAKAKGVAVPLLAAAYARLQVYEEERKRHPAGGLATAKS